MFSTFTVIHIGDAPAVFLYAPACCQLRILCLSPALEASFSVAFLALLALGTSTPAPACPPTARAPSATGLTRRGSDECKVHLDGLLEELCLVRAVNGCAGLLEGRVLDQRVSLDASLHQQSISSQRVLAQTHLDVTASSIQVQVHVFDLAILSKNILQRLLVCLFVDIGDDNDPTLDGADGRSFRMGLHVGLVARGRRGGRRVDVDIHFYVGHFEGVILGCRSVGGIEHALRCVIAVVMGELG